MKTIVSLLTLSVVLALSSCNNLDPAQRDQASALVDLALRYAEASGKIDAEDAALVREAKVIVLPETSPVETLPVVEVTSAK